MTAVTRWPATKSISVFADGSELWVGIADLRFRGILTEYSARRQRWRLDNFGITNKNPHPLRGRIAASPSQGEAINSVARATFCKALLSHDVPLAHGRRDSYCTGSWFNARYASLLRT